ncbi:hypothetical protein AQUCO_01000566v1 [Aquilegia coerulea]|uniref:Uncharacterized protein n=1 Tax=Aquilegia coerulea TaxID=218851 RepID=A0A2G5EAQ7_AQUCA|nr:hypothetical protein AQUCO_01000566v1 [Aquilegia coerulea]
MSDCRLAESTFPKKTNWVVLGRGWMGTPKIEILLKLHHSKGFSYECGTLRKLIFSINNKLKRFRNRHMHIEFKFQYQQMSRVIYNSS